MSGMPRESKAFKQKAVMTKHLDALAEMDHPQLKDEWVKLYGVPAPTKIGKDFLRHAVAYRLQEKAFGGLKPSVRRKLMRLAGGGSERAPSMKTRPSVQSRPVLRAGARLIREWNGETHVVEVVDGGFRWRERSFTSLSAIARAITGARWSGPRFFGLNGKSAECFRS